MKILTSKVHIIILLLSVIIITACQSGTNNPKELGKNENHKVIAEKKTEAGGYSYVFVDEDGKKFWIATNAIPIEIGETYYFIDELEMRNFESRILDTVFDLIYFVEKISMSPISRIETSPVEEAHSIIPPAEKAKIEVPPVEDGITIGELFANKNSFANETVKVSGLVTRFNEAIMGKNWVHLQDGTEDNGKFDLTVTTNEVVEVGNVVTFEGKIAIDKDFGAGYTYEVIMEEATLQDK